MGTDKKLLIILSALVFLLTISNLYFIFFAEKPFNLKNEPGVPVGGDIVKGTVSESDLREVKSCIDTYLALMDKNEWDEIPSLMCGEAKLLFEKSLPILEKQGNYSIIRSQYVKDFEVNGDIAWGRIYIESNRETNLESQILEVLLCKENNNWKIVGLDIIGDMLPTSYEFAENDLEAAREAISEAVKLVASGEWEKSLPLFTGLAKENAEATIVTGQHVIKSEISDLVIEPIKMDNRLGLFKVSYKIANDINKEVSDVEFLFRVKKIANQWKVYRTQIVKL